MSMMDLAKAATISGDPANVYAEGFRDGRASRDPFVDFLWRALLASNKARGSRGLRIARYTLALSIGGLIGAAFTIVVLWNYL